MTEETEATIEVCKVIGAIIAIAVAIVFASMFYTNQEEVNLSAYDSLSREYCRDDTPVEVKDAIDKAKEDGKITYGEYCDIIQVEKTLACMMIGSDCE